MLNLANEELDEPFYYDLSEMCSALHCVMPKHDQLRFKVLFFPFIYAFKIK